jgi:TP901 family phage tail tape measure protein
MLKGYGLDLEKMTEEGSALFKKFGVDVDGFAEKFGASSELLVGLAAAGVAIFEVGKEIFEVGEKFDEAFSVIGKSTGAVGPQLRELSDEFVKVMGSGVVQNIDDVSQAFSLLAQKLDLTGDALVQATQEFSSFADVNRTSVAESVRLVTDLMNQWNISIEDSTELMDQLTRAAQLTGKPVTEISQAVNQSSAQFKQLGFSLTDSIGFLTAFSKAGADLDITTRALNTAVLKLGEGGGDVAEKFRDLITEIRSGQDPQQAFSDAVDAFGSRAAPKMVDALRNARFDLEGFTEAIAAAGGTVEKTNEATETFGDKWAALGNKIMAAVEPIGEVFITVGKLVIDAINKIVEVLSNILTPAFDLLRDEFRDFGDAFKAVFGAVAAVLRGDWNTAWIEAQLAALNVIKAVLDFFSAMANQVIGIINNMTSALRTTLDAVGVHIKAIGAVSLAEVTGISETIKKLYASLDQGGDEATKKLGQQAAAREKIINDEAKTYDISIQERIKASLALEQSYELQQQAERSLTALTLQAASASTAAAQTFQQNAALIGGAITGLVEGPMVALGGALKTGENAWQALGTAALHSIGAIVKGFADQMAAKAALDYAQASAYASNPFTVAAAPGYYAQAAIETGAAAAGYVAAGALQAFERGTPYSSGGAAMLAEAGPELVMSPGVHTLAQGSAVLDAASTAKLMGHGKGTTLQFNIGKMDSSSVGATLRQAQAIARSMAFQGVL